MGRIQPGDEIGGRYRIEAKIGEGGIGSVYRATHKYLRTQVAIKVMQPRADKRVADARRFEREAFALGKVAHENCLAVTDFGEDDGLLFLVTELLEGSSLGDVLESEGRLPLSRTLDLMAQLLRALGHAHDQGVIHRDLKPDNVILVDRRGKPEFVKVLDFGLAKLKGETLAEDGRGELTQAGLTFGTPRYMAPEQALGGEIAPATDLYSLSVMAYRMLAGRCPFEDDEPQDLLIAQCTRVPPTFAEIGVDDIPQAVEKLIRRGLSKRAEDRHRSAYEYLDALDRCLSSREVGTADTVALRKRERSGEPPPSPHTAGGARLPTDSAAAGQMMTAPAVPPARSATAATHASPVLGGPSGGPAARPLWRKTSTWVSAAVVSILVVAGIASGGEESGDARAEPALSTDAEEAVPAAAPSTSKERPEHSNVRTAASPATAKNDPGSEEDVSILDSIMAGSGDGSAVHYDFSQEGLEDVRELIDNGRRERAIKVLLARSRSGSYEGRAAFLLGTLYFRKMYWSDGFKWYEVAIQRDATYARHPLVLANAVAGLGSRSRPWLAERFIRRRLGPEVLPYLERAAKGAKHKHHRERAARLAKRVRKNKSG